MKAKIGNYAAFRLDKDGSIDCVTSNSPIVELPIIITHIRKTTLELIEIACSIKNCKNNISATRSLDLKGIIDQISSPAHIGIVEMSNDIYSFDKTKILWLQHNKIVSISESAPPIIRENDFAICKGCSESSHMAEPNQEDGSFMCWSCRKYPMRNYY